MAEESRLLGLAEYEGDDGVFADGGLDLTHGFRVRHPAALKC